MTSTPPAVSGAAVALDGAIASAVETVRLNLGQFGQLYPDDITAGGRYLPRPAVQAFDAGANRGWTTSFWSGMRWLAWELTGESEFRDAAAAHAVDFAGRIERDEDLDTHDLGFLYTLGCVVPWRLTGDERARDTALTAADRLMTRFLDAAGVVQAWGDLDDPAQRGRTIIDSLMNMPLLTWAFEQTGDERYAEAVRRHTTALRVNILRDDDSTFHTFYWDAESGAPLRGGTAQGAFDDSCWARGQAWGIYGFAVNYLATGDELLLDAARRCARYLMAHLPADSVPFWDLVYTDGSGAPRDSSAAAIAAAGLFVLASAEPDAERAAAADRDARRILASLAAHYTPAEPAAGGPLLLHGVYDLPKDHGVDEGTLWGDYFYLEALMRATRPDWQPYW